jgi:hypothetical protein
MPARGCGPGSVGTSLRCRCGHLRLAFAEMESLGLRVRDAERRRQHEGRQPYLFHENSALLLSG